MFRIVISFCLLFLLIITSCSSSKEDGLLEFKKTGQDRYVLLFSRGKKLTREAFIYVEKNQWRLTFKGGKDVIYSILSKKTKGNKSSLLAVDNFKDTCNIAITVDGDMSTLEFKYPKDYFSFDGYYDR